MRSALIGIALLAVSSVAVAQDDGPKSGTWGGENSGASGGSLLRFRSPTSAWLFGINVLYAREDADPPSGFTGLDGQTTFSGSVELGLRTYRRVQEKARPYSTISVLVGYQDFAVQEGPNFGAAFELGSAYFFNPHVSLGVSGELSATYQSGDRELGTSSQRVTTIAARFSGFRLVGAVYF